MRAMVLDSARRRSRRRPLELRDAARCPSPAPGRCCVQVHRATRVCRTDLHVVEGELPDPKLPLVPGHQIVGTVERVGEGVERPRGRATASACRGSAAPTAPARTAARGRENLCDAPTFTGYQRDGGYAEYAVARADFVLPLPDGYPDLQAAPLLCAGLIGYRALRLADVEGRSSGRRPRLGLYGFGASAHIVIQVARHLGHEVYVVHARRGGPGVRARARRDVGRRRGRRAAGRARQRDHLRARRRARARARCARCARAAWSCAPAST